MRHLDTCARPFVEDLRQGTWVCVDTETTGLRVHSYDKPFAVGLRDYDGNVTTYEWPVDIYSREPQIPEGEIHDLATLLLCYDYVVFHNALFDVPALRQIGVRVSWGRVHDTMVMAHLVDSQEVKGLKPLSEHYFDFDSADEDVLLLHAKFATEYAKQNGLPVDNQPKANYWLPSALKAQGIEVPGYESCHEYLEGDIERTALLFELFRRMIMQKGLVNQYHRDMAVLPVYDAMSSHGMRLSPKVGTLLSGWEKETQEAKRELEAKIKVKNIDSPGELREVIYGRWKLKPPGYTAKGIASVDKESIGKLSERRTRYREFFLSLLNYRVQKTALKYVHSYLGLTDEEGLLHPGINPTGTHTTRTSSSNPNGQNVAKHSGYPTRQFFVPREGCELWAMDYSQLELRLFALASGDEVMKNELTREGGDLHKKTADIFGVDRLTAKGLNFGLLYGAGKTKLSKLAGVSAEEFITGMQTTYPEAMAFMRKQDQTGRRRGYIETLFGTPLWIDQGKTYSATNYTIQGSAGDVMKIGLIKVWDFLQREHLEELIRPLILVHDELVFEVDKSLRREKPILRRIKECLEFPGVLLDWPLPVDAERSRKSWGEMEAVQL